MTRADAAAISAELAILRARLTRAQEQGQVELHLALEHVDLLLSLAEPTARALLTAPEQQQPTPPPPPRRRCSSHGCHRTPFPEPDDLCPYHKRTGPWRVQPGAPRRRPR